MAAQNSPSLLWLDPLRFKEPYVPAGASKPLVKAGQRIRSQTRVPRLMILRNGIYFKPRA